jgi:hypothetical protein
MVSHSSGSIGSAPEVCRHAEVGVMSMVLSAAGEGGGCVGLGYRGGRRVWVSVQSIVEVYVTCTSRLPNAGLVPRFEYVLFMCSCDETAQGADRVCSPPHAHAGGHRSMDELGRSIGCGCAYGALHASSSLNRPC